MVVWQQHLHVREGDKVIIDNAIDNYPQNLWHPPGFEIVDPSRFAWWEEIYADNLVFIMGLLSAPDFAPFLTLSVDWFLTI